MAKRFLDSKDVAKVTVDGLATELKGKKAAKADLQPTLRSLVLKLGIFENLPEDAEITVSYSVKELVTPPPTPTDPNPQPKEEVKIVRHDEPLEAPKEAPVHNSVDSGDKSGV